MRGKRTIVASVGRQKETPGETSGNVELHHGIVEESPDSMTRITQGGVAKTGTCVEHILASRV